MRRNTKHLAYIQRFGTRGWTNMAPVVLYYYGNGISLLRRYPSRLLHEESSSKHRTRPTNKSAIKTSLELHSIYSKTNQISSQFAVKTCAICRNNIRNAQ